MALIGNRSVLHKSPGRFLAGSIASGDRANFNKHGMARNQQQALGKLADTPSGYGMTGWLPPRTAGAMSSRVVDLLFSQSLNLAGGVNIVGDSTAGISQTAVIQAVAFVDGTSSVSILVAPASIIGGYNLTGTAGVTSQFDGELSLLAYLQGTSEAILGSDATLGAGVFVSGSSAFTLIPDSLLIELAAPLNGAVQVTLSGSSSLALGFNLSGSTETSFSLNSPALLAIAEALGNGSASFTTHGGMRATGTLAGNILPYSELSPQGLADALMSYAVEGQYTLQDILQVLAAVAAGKTSIVADGNGGATVVFRSIDDTSDTVTATMSGSERTSIITN